MRTCMYMYLCYTLNPSPFSARAWESEGTDMKPEHVIGTKYIVCRSDLQGTALEFTCGVRQGQKLLHEAQHLICTQGTSLI
jgi:hypothetical protein